VTEDNGANTDASQSDSSPTEETLVDNDVPPPPVDSPVGNDAAMPSDDCWAQACGAQNVYLIDGNPRDVVSLSCDMMGQRISLSPAGLGCVATCHGDVCACSLDDTDGVSVESHNVRVDGHCGLTTRFSYTRNGTPMTPGPTEIGQLVRRQ
jgi:hypothetical protein